MEESGINDSWQSVVHSYFDDFSSQFLVANIELIDENSIINFQYVNNRVKFIQSTNQLVLSSYKDNVEELMFMIEN
jgi:hypothetical protein